jgi:hypothetical protein
VSVSKIYWIRLFLLKKKIEYENNYLVKRTTSINRAVLNGVIDNLGKRSQEITAVNLGVEEDLRTQESLVTDVNLERPLGNALNTLVDLERIRLGIVLLELLGHIRADIAVSFL